jgi:hypothetical protein
MDNLIEPGGKHEAASVEIHGLVHATMPAYVGVRVHLASEGTRVGGGISDPAIVKVLTSKATTVVIRSSRKQEGFTRRW